MKSRDIDSLLQDSFSGDPPTAAFRARVLRDSTAAFQRARWARVRWHWGVAGAAAILLMGVSFLVGRLTVPRSPIGGVAPAAQSASTAHEVAVSDDLIAWLDAARLFKQLGMEDRMARAIERAGKLGRHHSTSAGHAPGRVVAAIDARSVEEDKNPVGLAILPRLYEPIRSVDGIMASSLGGHNDASESD